MEKKVSYQVVTCGQTDEEHQLAEQKGHINVESNAHVIPLMIAGQKKCMLNDFAPFSLLSS